MDGRRPGVPTASPAAALLRGGLVPIGVVGAAAVIVGAVGSVPAASGAAAGMIIAAGAFAVGPAVLRTVSQWSPPAVMAAAVLAYLVVVGVLGVAYLALGRLAWLSHEALGVTLIACALAGIIGQARAAARLRVLAFGADRPVAPVDDAAAQPGRSGGSHTPRD